MLRIKSLIFAAALCFSCSAYAAETEITQTSVNTDGKTYSFGQSQPFVVGETVYVDASGFFSALGCEVMREQSIDALSVYGNGRHSVILSDNSEHIVGYGMYRYKHPSRYVDGREYIPLDLAEDICGREITVTGPITPLWDEVIGDDYRISEESAVDCGNCYVLNKEYMFSPVTIHDRQAEKYADIVNRIAESVPEAEVYSMLVPDSCEIYAPKRFYTDQKRAFWLIQQKISDRVKSINAVDALLSHADEKIYFSTDHHWTHRGAFYAWESFAKEKGFEAMSLNSFEKADTDAFSGSYVQRLGKGFSASDVLLKPTETMERFLPKYDTTVTIYSDSNMEKMIGRVPIINTKNNSYSCFISGDHPLSVIESSVGNGKKLAIIKESFGNALATWAVNNYQYVYVIDIRGFSGGKLKISDFYAKTQFDDLLIESYPTTIESKELSGYLEEFAG